MPPARRFCEALFRASLHLLVISVTALAIPVITQEFSRSSTPATATPSGTDTVSSTLSNKEVIDIVIPLLIFLLFFWCLSLAGGFPFPPFVVIKWMANTFRPIGEVVLYFLPGAVFRRAADDIVGPNDARAAPQAQGDDTPPAVPTVTSSHPPPAENVELDALPTARCAISASDDSGLTSPSS